MNSALHARVLGEAGHGSEGKKEWPDINVAANARVHVSAQGQNSVEQVCPYHHAPRS